MSRTAESYRIVNFFDWGGGIQDRRRNPLAFPPNALMAGENVELVDGGLKTRGGISITSSGSLPAGEVMALTQVRFPSNEVSYLVAQVRGAGVVMKDADATLIPGTNSPGERAAPYAAYDSANHYIWVFSGVKNSQYGPYYSDLWYYDCAAKTWHKITDATNQPAWTSWGEDMVYDPVNHRLIAYISVAYTYSPGDVWADLEIYGENFWAIYDIDGNSWTEVTATDHTSFAGKRPWGSRMIYRDGHVIRMGGLIVNGYVDFPVGNYFSLDLETMILSQVDCTTGGGAGIPTRGDFGMAYDAATDKIVVVGGSSKSNPPVGTTGKDAYELHVATGVWTPLPDIPTSMDYVSLPVAFACSGNYYSIGNAAFQAENPQLSDDAWKYSGGDTWENIAIINDSLPRWYHKGFVVDSDIVLVLGLEWTDSMQYGGGADRLVEMCLYPDNSAEGKPSFLYASPDNLPASTVTFTEIYDLGVADQVSFAVLNDRVVITEGKAEPPLVWGGCMTDDGSDWMYPKAVLVSQDGENFYDVSAEVLDKDVDNAANIGLIRSAGYLAVCTDMPLVEGFYFGMETPNGVETEDPGNQQAAVLALTSEDYVTRQDLKGLVANWVQDSGATGHFTDSSNNTVTLGSGNQCPDVETGLRVVFAATASTILDIIGDGSGSGAVTLSSSIASQAVTEITGFSAIDANGLAVNKAFSPLLTAWSKTPGTDSMRCSGYSIRQVLAGSEIAHHGDTLKLTIRSGDFTYSLTELRGDHHWKAYQSAFPMLISRISIVERDGETANGVTDPTPITFPIRPFTNAGIEQSPYFDSTHPSFVFTNASGTFYATICANEDEENFTSDRIEFTIDETKDYLLIMDVMDVWTRSTPARLNSLHRTTGAGYYLISDPVNAPETWNIADVTDYSPVFQDGYAIGAVEIQVQDRFPLPTQLLVAHTTDAIHFDMSVIEDFQGVTVSQTAAGTTHVYHAVSLDDRATFKVFKESAWRTIVRESGGVWQYLDGSDVWQNASTDSLLVALREAFAIAENQMNAAELEAITSAQWTGTGAIVVHITPHMDFAMGMLADATRVPAVASYTLTYNDTGAITIQGWRGDRWTAGSGFTDHTRLNDIPWGQSGTVMYNGTTPFEAQYHVLNEVPGYWFRFMTNGTSAGTAITRILFKAPCQPLANIGDGQPDTPLACIFHDVSKDSKKDLTLEVSNSRGSFTTDTEGKIVYHATDALIPMGTDDYLYVGYLLEFDQIEITPYDSANAVVSTLSAEYWNGEAWTALEITDETVDEDTGTKTLFTKGKISWLLPDDWKMHIPLDADFPRGYYVRFKVSVALSATTSIDEVRVYAIPKELAKHKFAVSFRDRIALVSRPDAPDQVDISRALEEYGFIGEDSGSYRVGGMDSIQCAVSAWNGLFLGKTETWHQLIGRNPETFSCEGVEAARHIPLNSRVIVKAPMAGIDAGTRYGLFYINRFGAFVSTGLQTDTAWNTGRGALLSDSVNWWDGRALPRLDLDSLHLACGEYWPVKNWIIWSVPMITATGQTSQATNNRLIIFDMALRTWLPPFTISAASLTAAYHCNTNAPGGLGEMGLYAGDYQGRIMRLFGPADTTDLGDPIAAWIETGWLHLGSPEWIKLIRHFQIYGHTATGKNVTVKIWVDGNTDPLSPNHTILLSDLDELGGKFFCREEASLNTQGRFFKLRIECQDVAHIFGIQIGASLIREWGAH